MAIIDITKLPKELIIGRDETEGAVIMTLYKNPEYYNEYCSTMKPGIDFITDSGMFYFTLFQRMIDANYKAIDNISIEEFLTHSPKLREQFDIYGGYPQLEEMKYQLVSENFQTHYDKLIHDNIFIRFYINGFNVMGDYKKYAAMSTQDLLTSWQHKIDDINAINDGGVIEVMNLSEGYQPFFEEWDKGHEVGFPIAIPGINYLFMGVHRKNLMLHAANIGIGKTTSAIAWYIIPAIKEGNNVTIIANEQDESEWRQMLIATVLFGEVGNIKGLNRHKIRKGKYTEENKADLAKAEAWLKSQPGKVLFREAQDYRLDEVKKIIKKQSNLGCGLFIFDVLKPFDEASEKAWAEFSETAKALFLLAKNLDVAIIATCQLSPEAYRRTYLDLNCIGKSKGIAETVSNVLMFRPLTKIEKANVHPWKYDGEDHKVKITLDLDDSKDYIAVFFPKNRYGETYPELVVERNMSFNTYNQIGWYEFPRDIIKK